MTRQDRRLDRLRSIPADLKWAELVAVLSALGYTQQNGSGSRRKFWRADNLAPITLHEPHGSAPVCKQALRDIVDLLDKTGLIES